MPAGQAPRRRRLRDVPLVWRVFTLNTGVLLAASGVLLFTPVTVSSPVSARELGTICAGLLVMLVVDLVLVRRTLEPLGRVARQMEHVDLLRPGSVRVDEPLDGELATPARAFNAMLARLEDERRAGAERSVRALEGERRRVARELHDEVGQALTGMLLHLERAARGATGTSVDEIEAAREAARHALEDVRRIARQLRPEVLDDLGLASALRSLCGAVGPAADIRVACHLDDDLPALSHDGGTLVHLEVPAS
jgi:two-component system sensor histidine kinase UhpB